MKKSVFLFSLLLCTPLMAQGKTVLQWEFKPDETLGIEKTTVQEILKDGRLARRYAIRDEYSLSSGPAKDGVTPLSGTYRSFERNIGPSSDPWLLTSEIPLVFGISPEGVYTVAEHLVYPTIRDIPAFPSTPVGPGDSWELPGSELFPFTPPVTIPVQVRYTWLSNRMTNERSLAVLYFEYDFDKPGDLTTDRPNRFTGESRSVLLFDTVAGLPVSLAHGYAIRLTYIDGTTITYQGSLGGKYLRRKKVSEHDRIALSRRIERSLPSRKDSGVTVRPAPEGVIITLDEILFDFDSDRIKPEAERVIGRIGNALKANPGVAVIVEGHTDDRGNEEYNQGLSERRARAVLGRLFAGGWVDPRIASFIGKGKSEPVASNATEEGRRKNRRVEILLRQE
jgi:outer membrane protein OmpA-like peptidoglycan-associated protein